MNRMVTDPWIFFGVAGAFGGVFALHDDPAAQRRAGGLCQNESPSL